MLRSVTCIVTRIKPLLDLFADDDTGIVVGPGSVDELADAMRKIYSDPALRKRLGMNARIKAVEILTAAPESMPGNNFTTNFGPGRAPSKRRERIGNQSRIQTR